MFLSTARTNISAAGFHSYDRLRSIYGIAICALEGPNVVNHAFFI